MEPGVNTGAANKSGHSQERQLKPFRNFRDGSICRKSGTDGGGGGLSAATLTRWCASFRTAQQSCPHMLRQCPTF